MNRLQFYRNYLKMRKQAASLLTPEAMQAAQQPPPMDPAMAGGMPPQGGAPMDPAMMGGMPPQGGAPMDPSMMGGMPPQGGALPPEIMQDQMFLQFLAEMAGIMVDPNSGMFFDQQGAPVPPEMIMQIYDQYMQQMAQMQGGMSPQGGAPMDPAMMGGMPPQGGAPMDPAMMGIDPAAMGGDPAMMGGMPPQDGAPMEDTTMAEAGATDEAMMEMLGNAIMEKVDASLQQYTAALDKKISALLDKIDALADVVDSLQNTTDKRAKQDIDEDAMLRDELAADLNPTGYTAEAPSMVVLPKSASRAISLFDIINSGL